MSTTEVAGLDWSAERLIPGFQSVTHLDVCTVTGASNETNITLATLVGLVNRPQPKIYLIMGDDEAFWLKEVFGDIPQNSLSATGDNALGALLDTYHSSIKGTVIYDPNLKDSINIAIMLAAQQDSIAVSPTQASALQNKYHFHILGDLRTHGWKSRLQAYHWALQNLRNGCSSRLVAGLSPGNMNLLSFLVATRSFIYNLDSRNYLPSPVSLLTDGLLSERELIRQILASFPAGAVHLGWFADESSGVNLTSQAAITVLATDLFSNLEVWTAAQPVSLSAVAPVSPHRDELTPAANTVYVSFTISDGDNLQYTQHRMKNIWRDPGRSTLPIGWTLSPSLIHAAPRLAEYYLKSASPNDEFIAGPSGAGYIFPSHWPAEHLDAFLQITGKQMQAMTMTTLEVLDTDYWQSSGLPFISNIRQTGMIFSDEEREHRFAQALFPFGLQGILSGAGLKKVESKVIDGVAFYQNLGLADSVNGTVKMIKNVADSRPERPLFLNVYMLAWKIGPSDLNAIVQQLGSSYEIVLPRTLLAMLAEAST
ncbi:MAG: GxGYxYP family putative glycoside hydrolase [Ktedonobacteraceae bacterium]